MKKNQPRERTILADFVAALRQVQSFKDLPEKAQLELAHMMWSDSMKVRGHESVDGATSYSHQELNRRFGRGRFKAVNEAAKAFDTGPWSMSHGLTRTFRLMPAYQDIKDQFLRQVVREQRSSYLIDIRGQRVRIPQRAIASKRRDGATAHALSGVELRPSVPINTRCLTDYYEHLDGEIRRHQQVSVFLDRLAQARHDKAHKALIKRRDAAAMLLAYAYADLGGPGAIPMRYREARSGRLYATGFNLQNCPKEVRFAALDGCWDYDISNCHFTLLAQMSEEYGFACPEIHHYLANKTTMRNTLAFELGVDAQAIKVCLLALIYDAPLSCSRYAAIGRALGKEKAGRLLEKPQFTALADEVKRAGRHVVSLWPTSNKSLINHSQCGIPAYALHKQKLAHLLHGAEALILKTAIVYAERQQRGNVLLLQHDGFSVQQRIDVIGLNTHVKQLTGFDAVFIDAPIQSMPIPKC